jgi:hypothetical protein
MDMQGFDSREKGIRLVWDPRLLTQPGNHHMQRAGSASGVRVFRFDIPRHELWISDERIGGDVQRFQGRRE